MLKHTLSVSYDLYKTKAEVLAALRAQAAKTPQGEWIYATLYDNILHGGYLTIDELDAVTSTHPIMVYYLAARLRGTGPRSMHPASARRRANFRGVATSA